MTGRLIGIGGHLGAGKDAIADHLVERHGFVKIGFSDPLNDAMTTLNPLVETSDGFQRYADVIAERGYVDAKRVPEVRRLLQVLGTEIGRNLFGDDVWSDIARQRSRELRWAGQDVVITGVRFPNEVAMIRREQGLSVWVTRPGHEGANHASERSVTVDDFDVLIRNTGTLEELHDAASRQLLMAVYG